MKVAVEIEPKSFNEYIVFMYALTKVGKRVHPETVKMDCEWISKDGISDSVVGQEYNALFKALRLYNVLRKENLKPKIRRIREEPTEMVSV